MKKLLLTLIVLFFVQMSMAQQQDMKMELDPAFVHSVYFWLHNPDKAEDRAEFETAIKKLLKDSKYTKTNYLGTPPKAIRDVVDDSFTYNLLVTFESEEAQEMYQTEEAHLEFIESAKHLWNKVVVYDAIGLKE